MPELLFCVKAYTNVGDRVFIAGSLSTLGNWNTQYALPLNLRKDYWEGSLDNVQLGNDQIIKEINFNSK